MQTKHSWTLIPWSIHLIILFLTGSTGEHPENFDLLNVKVPSQWRYVMTDL